MLSESDSTPFTATPPSLANAPDAPPHPNGEKVNVSPLQSPETFQAYCTRVQTRLAEQARQRQAFLQTAYDRLTALMQAARAVEDAPLYQALAQQRAAAQELLSALNRQTQAPNPSLSNGVPHLPPQSRPTPTQEINGSYAPRAVAASYAPPVHNAPPRDHVGATTIFSASTSITERAVVVTPRLPRRPVRPLESIEAEASRLRNELREWGQQNALTYGDNALDVPNCLRARSFACRQRRLEEEAGDTEVAEVAELAEDILALLDEAGDDEYSVALDDELETPPTAFQWGEMAERYQEMARAYEAYQWWRENEHRLTVGDLQPLVEAIAATQQRFNRMLFKIGARDPFQQQLFDALRYWAREQQCYLHSLRPKAPIQELIERAASLEAAWEMARQPLKEPEAPASESETPSTPEPAPEAVVAAEATL